VSVPLARTPWDSSRGTPHRPRGFAPAVSAWDAQAALDDLGAAEDADRVYAYAEIAAPSSALSTRVGGPC
jgi:hypothetical protein